MKQTLLLVSLGLFLFSCGEVKLGRTDIIGTWTLVENEVNGKANMLNNNLYFAFNEDNSYKSGTVGSDPTVSGTWSYSEKADSSFLGMKNERADVQANISKFGYDTIKIEYSYNESKIKFTLAKEFNVNELPH